MARDWPLDPSPLMASLKPSQLRGVWAGATYGRGPQQAVVSAELVHLEPCIGHALRAVLLLDFPLEVAVKVQPVHAAVKRWVFKRLCGVSGTFKAAQATYPGISW